MRNFHKFNESEQKIILLGFVGRVSIMLRLGWAKNEEFNYLKKFFWDNLICHLNFPLLPPRFSIDILKKAHTQFETNKGTETFKS